MKIDDQYHLKIVVVKAKLSLRHVILMGAKYRFTEA